MIKQVFWGNGRMEHSHTPPPALRTFPLMTVVIYDRNNYSALNTFVSRWGKGSNTTTVSAKRKYTLASKASTRKPGGLPIWSPSVLSTQLDKSLYFLLGETVYNFRSPSFHGFGDEINNNVFPIPYVSLQVTRWNVCMTINHFSHGWTYSSSFSILKDVLHR